MIGVGFVYFRTLSLDHLDAAWYTVSRQSFSEVSEVVVLDNNTEDEESAIREVLDRYPLPVPVRLVVDKHGDPARTQSWSANRVVSELGGAEWVFFTRADFLLAYDCLRVMAEYRHPQKLITSHCLQMGYDNALSNTDALAPHSERSAPWRYHLLGPRSLIGKVPAVPFTSTGEDAGVWLVPRDVARLYPFNERLSVWGYQQSEWQRLLRQQGIRSEVVPDYLYYHQHHWAPRDFVAAAREFNKFGRV